MKHAHTRPRNALFLHIGPGLNAHAERVALSDHLPKVHFWDQPFVRNPDRAFEELVEAAQYEIKNLIKESGEPIHLMAHSFGGHLIRPLLTRVPDLISSCEMISTGYNPHDGLLNLARIMKDDPNTDSALKRDLDAFLKRPEVREPSVEAFEELALLLTRDPNYMKHYWPDQDEYAQYLKIFSLGRPFDLTTFKYVTADFIRYYLRKEIVYTGPVPISIQLGGRDPLINEEVDRANWKRVFPSAEIHIIPKSGHFIHLEGKI